MVASEVDASTDDSPTSHCRRYCLTACPYHARTSDFGLFYGDEAAAGAPMDGERAFEGGIQPWEESPSFEYAKLWQRRHGSKDSPMGNARKCHFCLHRLEVGQLPLCVSTCIGRATFLGDDNDPDSLVKELVTRNQTQTLLPHLGTRPRVFYIV